MTLPDILPNRFLNWRIEADPFSGKPRKVPCLRDGRKCDAHDPANHITYAEAAEASGLGVAYDIRAEDGWFFLDMDNCGPEWTPEATAIFESFKGAWGEISQSGTGLHILGRCDPARLADRRNKWAGWLEMYVDGRFIAFGDTGWQVIGGGTATGQDWTAQLLKVVPEREHLGELPEGVDPAYTGPADDDALIAAMLRSAGGAGAKFEMKATVGQLWNADAVVLSRLYPAFDGSGGFDHSSADAALMSHLAFWTGKDMPRMDRLFRRSALMRPKYEARADYRRDTIQGAARLCETVYDRPTAPVAVAAAGGGEVYLTVAEMHAYFAGCIYIRDTHRVLVPDGAMLKSEQFNAVYGGRIFQMMPDGTQPTKKAFEALTENRATTFPQAIRPTFRPDLPPRTILSDGSVNTYVPPNVPMIKGDVTRFLDLMRRLLPDENDRATLLAYMAAVVQHPGVKFQWAPVLQGCEGNGKTMLFSTVAYAVGEQYATYPNARQIASQFNSWIEGKVFSLIEEFHMEGRREILDAWKPLITNVKIDVEGKGQDKRKGENRSNFAFCTNFQDAVLKSRNDRRYAIFFCAQQQATDLVRDGMNGNYFPDLWDWLRNGGYQAVAYYLANYAIPPALDPAGACHRAPETTSTDASIAESLGLIEQEILEAAENNTVGFRGGWVSSWALDKLVRDLNMRIGPKRIPRILASLGYERFGRASKQILQEDGKKPVLYKKPGVPDGFSAYETAQHYPA
jgi:hypothetical protein